MICKSKPNYCTLTVNFQELNLDLVNFPRPVIVKEVRVIPLGTRVKADVPGGVRLGYAMLVF